MSNRTLFIVFPILFCQMSQATSEVNSLSAKEIQSWSALNEPQPIQKKANTIRMLRHLREKLVDANAELSSKALFKIKSAADLHRLKNELEAKIRKFEKELTKRP